MKVIEKYSPASDIYILEEDKCYTSKMNFASLSQLTKLLKEASANGVENPPDHQFIVLGGTCHNESALFCRTCGDAFVCASASSLCREVTAEEAVYG